jgi:uncharacterized protein (TIGR03067 family)
MRKTTIAVLALCALAALAGRADEADPEPDTTKAELKKLQGTWTVTKVWIKGKEREPSLKMTWAFDGDKLTWAVRPAKAKGPGTVGYKGTVTYKVKVDTKKKPYTIEMTPEKGKDKGKGQPGLFKFEKGELYLALGRGEAPKDFKGDDAPVYVMTREKAKVKAKE